jgi:hypothetical protein
MKIAFRIYSDVLQGRRETIEALMHSRAGVAFALKMFVIVMLVAGLGHWFGIPVAIRQPLLSERIQSAGDAIEEFGQKTTAKIDEYMSTFNQENLPATLNKALDDLVAQGVVITTDLLVQALADAGVTPGQLEQALSLIRLNRAQIDARLIQMLEGPLHERQLFSGWGLSQEQIAQVDAQFNAITEEVNNAIDQAQADVERLEPPAGARTSRVVRIFGQWLAIPFAMARRWLFFALVALLVTKLLGGRATVAQHLAAVALAAAPAVLLLVTFIPVMNYVAPLPYSIAIHYFGRTLALIALGWSALILLKTLAVAHDFSFWRSAGALVLTWLVIWVIIPAASLAALAYVWWG